MIEWTPCGLAPQGSSPVYHTEFAEAYLNTTDSDTDDERVDRELRNLGYLTNNRESNRSIFAEEFGPSVSESNEGIHSVHCSGTQKLCRVPIHR